MVLCDVQLRGRGAWKERHKEADEDDEGDKGAQELWVVRKGDASVFRVGPALWE